MKVNLSINNPNCMVGYLNLDPFVTEAGSQKVKCDVSNIDDFLDSAECTELIARDVLTYFDSNTIDLMLNNWISKIRKNGTIELSDIDINRVYKAFARGDLDILSMNRLLFGEQTKKWDLRKCGLTMDCISEMLRNKGFQVIETTYHNYNFVVKAKRIN